MKRTVLSALVFFAGISALGQETALKTFGTSQESAQRVGMWDFEPTRSTLTYDTVTGEETILRHATTSGGVTRGQMAVFLAKALGLQFP